MCFAPLIPFPSTSTCHCCFCCIVAMHHTATRRVVVSICVLSLFLSPHTHTHARAHCDTEPTSAYVSLLRLLLLVCMWCAQPAHQQDWGRRSSGDCRGAEEQQHVAEAIVSAVCGFGCGCDCACADSIDEACECVVLVERRREEGEDMFGLGCGLVLWWMNACALHP